MIVKPTRDIAALIALIEERADIAFAWRRRRDCASFAIAAIEAQSGINVLGARSWNNRREAEAVIAAEGGFVAALDRRMNQTAPALAMRGDIAGIADEAFGVRLMVVEGQMLVAPGDTGLERRPRATMIMAWDAMSARSPHE